MVELLKRGIVKIQIPLYFYINFKLIYAGSTASCACEVTVPHSNTRTPVLSSWHGKGLAANRP
jgi:hypothetical protein